MSREKLTVKEPEIEGIDRWMQRGLTYVPLALAIITGGVGWTVASALCWVWLAVVVGLLIIKKNRQPNVLGLELELDIEIIAPKQQKVINELIQPKPNVKLTEFKSVHLEFDNLVFREVDSESDYWGYAFTFQNTPNPPEKVGITQNVKAQISFYPLDENIKTYTPIYTACWISTPTSNVSFQLNKIQSVLCGAIKRKNGSIGDEFIIFEYDENNHKPVQKAILNYTEGFQVSAKLIIGEYGEFSFETPRYFVIPRGKRLAEQSKELVAKTEKSSKKKEVPPTLIADIQFEKGKSEVIEEINGEQFRIYRANIEKPYKGAIINLNLSISSISHERRGALPFSAFAKDTRHWEGIKNLVTAESGKMGLNIVMQSLEDKQKIIFLVPCNLDSIDPTKGLSVFCILTVSGDPNQVPLKGIGSFWLNLDENNDLQLFPVPVQ